MQKIVTTLKNSRIKIDETNRCAIKIITKKSKCTYPTICQKEKNELKWSKKTALLFFLMLIKILAPNLSSLAEPNPKILPKWKSR